MSSYNDALKSLSDEVWNRLSVQEKMDSLQAIENEIAKRENRTPCRVEGKYIKSDSRGTVLGYYSRADRTITINTEQLDPNAKYGKSYKSHVDTVLHEGRHAYQHQAVRGEIKHENKEELAAWTDNMQPGHYITFERNPRAYRAQPIELDARTYAEKKLQVIEEDKKNLKLKTWQEKPDNSGMQNISEPEHPIQREKKNLYSGTKRDIPQKGHDESMQTPSHSIKKQKMDFSSPSSQPDNDSDSKKLSVSNSPHNKETKKAMFSGATAQSSKQKSHTSTSAKNKGHSNKH